jgi:hypothetical protein
MMILVNNYDEMMMPLTDGAHRAAGRVDAAMENGATDGADPGGSSGPGSVLL